MTNSHELAHAAAVKIVGHYDPESQTPRHRHTEELRHAERVIRKAINDATADLREALDETVNHVGRNVVCVYPNCGCDGARNCDAIRGPSERATSQNIEGKVNVEAAFPYRSNT